jgi:hypothetical protein
LRTQFEDEMKDQEEESSDASEQSDDEIELNIFYKENSNKSNLENKIELMQSF